MAKTFPPVPQKLREMLKDYPEHIERLQEALDSVISEPIKSVPPFEAAIWALEDLLSLFITEARRDLAGLQQSGDSTALDEAKAKEFLMLRARSPNGGMAVLDELWAFFDQSRGAR